jgi:hypothetical protein
MNKTLLLNLDHVKQRGGTNYIEIAKNAEHSCWREDSIYIHSAIWQDCFDAIAQAQIPKYDFYAFTDLEPATAIQLADKLEELASLLDDIQKPEQLKQPPLLSTATLYQHRKQHRSTNIQNYRNRTAAFLAIFPRNPCPYRYRLPPLGRMVATKRAERHSHFGHVTAAKNIANGHDKKYASPRMTARKGRAVEGAAIHSL